MGSVQLRVSEKTPGTAVSPGKCVCRGLMTGGAPDRKYLGTRMRRGRKQAMGWEMGNGGKKGELSLITSKTSEFPMLTNITKWFQVRCQHRRGKRSAQALTQSNSSQEVVRRQRSWPSLSHTSIWTRVKGQGQEVSLDTTKVTL